MAYGWRYYGRSKSSIEVGFGDVVTGCTLEIIATEQKNIAYSLTGNVILEDGDIYPYDSNEWLVELDR